MKHIIGLKFGMFCHKIFFNGLAIEHIEAIAGGDPQVAFFIGTHTVNADIRKAIACIEVLENNIGLGRCFQHAQNNQWYGDRLFQ